MTCWALVPLKRRAACKQRLAGALAPQQRLQLVRLMLDNVCDALRRARCIDAFALVSEERDAAPADIPLLGDAGAGLNEALVAARRAVIERGADALLVLPADLPFVGSADIEALVAAGGRAGWALAADRAGSGTNALWLPAHLPFRFQFGPGSCQRHLEEAARLGLAPAVVTLPGLAFDVDGPADLQELRARNDARYLSLDGGLGGNQWQLRRQRRCG